MFEQRGTLKWWWGETSSAVDKRRLTMTGLPPTAKWLRRHLQCRRQDAQVRSLTREDPLEEVTATHSDILAWKIPWAVEPGRLRVQRVEKSRVWLSTHTREAWEVQGSRQSWSSPHWWSMIDASKRPLPPSLWSTFGSRAFQHGISATASQVTSSPPATAPKDYLHLRRAHPWSNQKEKWEMHMICVTVSVFISVRYETTRLPWWFSCTVCLPSRRPRLYPLVRRSPWCRQWQSTPAFLPGELCGQKSLVGYSPWSQRVRHDGVKIQK